MKHIILKLFLLLTLMDSSYSKSIKKFFYSYSGRFFELHFYQEKKLLISSHCSADIKNSNCQAIKLLKDVNEYRFKEIDNIGGKDPGSALCRKQLKGNVIIAKKVSGEIRHSVCYKTKSIISLSSLYYYWRIKQ